MGGREVVVVLPAGVVVERSGVAEVLRAAGLPRGVCVLVEHVPVDAWYVNPGRHAVNSNEQA